MIIPIFSLLLSLQENATSIPNLWGRRISCSSSLYIFTPEENNKILRVWLRRVHRIVYEYTIFFYSIIHSTNTIQWLVAAVLLLHYANFSCQGIHNFCWKISSITSSWCSLTEYLQLKFQQRQFYLSVPLGYSRRAFWAMMFPLPALQFFLPEQLGAFYQFLDWQCF